MKSIKQRNNRKPLWIDPELQQQVKIQAAKEGRSIREVAESLLKKWLDRKAAA